MCHTFHPFNIFPDNITMRCTKACGNGPGEEVEGCALCAGRGVCRKCSQGMLGFTSLELSDDGSQCRSDGRAWLYVSLGVASVLGFVVLAYLLHLSRRGTTKEGAEVLEKALQRSEVARTELLMPQLGDTGPTLLGTDVRHFSGRGAALYFHWLLFGMVVTILLGSCTYVGYELSDFRRQVKASGTTCDYLSELGSASLQQWDHHDFHVPPAGPVVEGGDLPPGIAREAERVAEALGITRVLRGLMSPFGSAPTRSVREKYDQLFDRMFVTAVVAYALVLLFSAGFGAYQLLVVSRRFDTFPSMRQFTVVLSNIPYDLTDGRKITDWALGLLGQLNKHDRERLWSEHSHHLDDDRARDCPPDVDDYFNVVGTSIAFDYFDQKDRIDEALEYWLYTLDKKTNRPDDVAQKAVNQDGKRINKGTQTMVARDTLDMVAEHDEVSHDSIFADKLLMNVLGVREDPLTRLSGSGTAFVVFESSIARDAFIGLASKRSLSSIPGYPNNRIVAAKAPCEPVNVVWHNFSVWYHFPHKIALGVILMLCMIFMWVSLYLPYVALYVDVIMIPGVQPSTIMDGALGLVIALGNFLLSCVIELVTSWAGFVYKPNRDQVVLSLAFLGTFLNTASDLCMIAIIAQGTVFQDAFSGKSTGYDTAIAQKLFSLIVPGYLFTPYFVIVFADHFLPRWLAQQLVRTHRRIPPHRAIQAVQFRAWDIVWRYADILNNTTICIVPLFFTSPYGWRVMIWLCIFFVFIYIIDRELLLKHTMPTIYDTYSLSHAFVHWWNVPTGLLAALVAFWGYKAQAGMFRNPYLGLAFVVAHALIYSCVVEACFLRLGHMRSQTHLMRYSEAADSLRQHHRHWDFFNCNPVYCLRTRLLSGKESEWERIAGAAYRGEQRKPRECVPFKRGSASVLRRDIERRQLRTGDATSTAAGPAGASEKTLSAARRPATSEQ
jgi:hypothetical protein